MMVDEQDRKQAVEEVLPIEPNVIPYCAEQHLDRNFNLLSISAVGLVTGSTWPALGGSIVWVTVPSSLPQKLTLFDRLLQSTMEGHQVLSTNCIALCYVGEWDFG